MTEAPTRSSLQVLATATSGDGVLVSVRPGEEGRVDVVARIEAENVSEGMITLTWDKSRARLVEGFATVPLDAGSYDRTLHWSFDVPAKPGRLWFQADVQAGRFTQKSASFVDVQVTS